jgi:D-beta-D-heptose 7-phosphate kinase/D-beta-D-heptose 1-phosphate adenosyltransferase
MKEKLLKAVANIGSPRILLVGDFMLDIYVYGDTSRISPEAPVPILKVLSTEYSCGGASSVAKDLCVLGAKVDCLGAIGDDDNGKKLNELLNQCGGDTESLIVLKNKPTITKQRLIGLAQHRHKQQLFRMDYEDTKELNDEQNLRVMQQFKKRLSKADLVCLQDYNKGTLSQNTCREMIALTKEAGKKVLVDPASIKVFEKYKGASAITPNRREASEAMNIQIEDEVSAEKTAEKLLEELDLEAAIITMDKQGAYLRTREKGELLGTVVRQVYDVTGAGDMVLATLSAALAAGEQWRTAVQLANIAGGLEVQKFGVAAVTIDEIINEIILQNRNKDGKILQAEPLVKELDYQRGQDKKIVFTNGCFDVIHRGHIEYLRFCRNQGDILVVGINSDSSVKQIKGEGRPINNQHDRAAVLAAMEFVDYVTYFNEPDPLELIKKVRPDILVKGRDWEHKGVVGREFVESRGGEVVLADLVEGKSSTNVIEKIKKLWKKQES